VVARVEAPNDAVSVTLRAGAGYEIHGREDGVEVEELVAIRLGTHS
jgi:hypothetical protein